MRRLIRIVTGRTNTKVRFCRCDSFIGLRVDNFIPILRNDGQNLLLHIALVFGGLKEFNVGTTFNLMLALFAGNDSG